LAPVPRTKEVVPLAQSFSTPEELAAAKGSFAFSWEASQWASAYELQVSSNKSFARPQEYKTDATEKEVAVAAPGSYAWRVRSVDAASGPLSLWSEARVAKYSKELKAPEPRAIAAIEPTPMPTPKPTPMPTPVEEILAPPAALEPRPSTSVVALRGSSSFVSFKWTPVGGATSYRLEISTDRAFASTSRAVDVSKTSFFVHSLPAGNYFWRVRATVKQKPTLWSEPTQLNVTATK
jgi:predicted secreted protein